MAMMLMPRFYGPQRSTSHDLPLEIIVAASHLGDMGVVGTYRSSC